MEATTTVCDGRDLWINQKQAAELLGVNRVTINQWHSRGLPYREGRQNTNLYHIPALIHFYTALEWSRNGAWPRSDAAFLIACSHLIGAEDKHRTINLLCTTFGFEQSESALIVGAACFFLGINCTR